MLKCYNATEMDQEIKEQVVLKLHFLSQYQEFANFFASSIGGTRSDVHRSGDDNYFCG